MHEIAPVELPTLHNALRASEGPPMVSGDSILVHALPDVSTQSCSCIGPVRRAKVALARKLTTMLHRIWTDGTEFV